MPPQLFINAIITGAQTALLGWGFLLTLSVSRFFNFTHGAFFLLAPYVALALSNYWELPLSASCILGICISVVVAISLDRAVFLPLTRRKSPPLALLLASLGLYVAIENAVALTMGGGIQILYQLTNTEGYALGDLRITAIQIVTIAASLILFVFLAVVWRHSRTGLKIRALANDAELAECAGIDALSIRTVVVAAGTGMAAFAGILVGLDIPLLPTMGLNPLMLCFVAVVLGEPFGILGVGVASLLLGIARSYGAWILGSEWQDATVLFLFLLALYVGKESFSNRRT